MDNDDDELWAWSRTTRPLAGLLVLLFGLWLVAVLIGRPLGLAVVTGPYPATVVVEGLARDRGAWGGYTLPVQGRIVQLRAVLASDGPQPPLVRTENMPLSLLECPRSPATPRPTPTPRPSTGTHCRIVPAHGIIRIPRHPTQSQRRISLYLALQSPPVRGAPAVPLWVAVRTDRSPTVIPWGGTHLYRVALAPGSTRPCTGQVCWDGVLVGVGP